MKMCVHVLFSIHSEKRTSLSQPYKSLVILKDLFIFKLPVPLYGVSVVRRIVAVMGIDIHIVWLFALFKYPRLWPKEILTKLYERHALWKYHYRRRKLIHFYPYALTVILCRYTKLVPQSIVVMSLTVIHRLSRFKSPASFFCVIYLIVWHRAGYTTP